MSGLVDSVKKALTTPLGTMAQATALSIALAPIAGNRSIPISRNGDEYILVPDRGQVDLISQWIIRQLKKEPGNVRVDVSDIWPKVVFRMWWPYILGIGATGAIAGYLLAGKK